MFKISDWFKLIVCTVLSSGVATAGNFGQMNFAYWQTVSTGPSVTYLVVAGGGGGAGYLGGGGGAGGFLTGSTTLTLGTTYTVTVGSGGAGKSVADGNGTNGNNSIISGTGLTTITAIGGGGGVGEYGSTGSTGGSGGGDAGLGRGGGPGSGTSGQGNSGGTGGTGASGGGGAGAAGGNGQSGYFAGNGGNGLQSSITGTVTYYAGGGAGGSVSSAGGGSATSVAYGGLGGGGNGDLYNSIAAQSGAANTGGGGGGSCATSPGGGSGGSGVVIISLPSGYGATTTGTVTTLINGSNTVYTFTSSGSFTIYAASGVVTSGLVFYVDATLSSSYSGSGTTWYDLSTNGYNATISGSPSYTSGTSGNFYFVSGKYAQPTGYTEPAITTSTSFTWILWFKTQSLDTNPIIGCRRATGNDASQWNKLDDNGIFEFNYGPSSIVSVTPPTLSTNTWYCACVVNNAGSITYYLNNASVATGTVGTSATNTFPFYIGADAIATGENGNANVSVVMIYNKALSTTERNQNFIYMRARYGL